MPAHILQHFYFFLLIHRKWCNDSLLLFTGQKDSWEMTCSSVHCSLQFLKLASLIFPISSLNYGHTVSMKLKAVTSYLLTPHLCGVQGNINAPMNPGFLIFSSELWLTWYLFKGPWGLFRDEVNKGSRNSTNDLQ